MALRHYGSLGWRRAALLEVVVGDLGRRLGLFEACRMEGLAHPEFGLSTRGLFTNDKLTFKSLLDGFYLGDNLTSDGDQYEIGVTFDIHLGIEGVATVLGFDAAEIYGEGGLQLFFAATAIWGWWQWLFGKREDAAGTEKPLIVARLRARSRVVALCCWLMLWPAAGLLLAHVTDRVDRGA